MTSAILLSSLSVLLFDLPKETSYTRVWRSQSERLFESGPLRKRAFQVTDTVYLRKQGVVLAKFRNGNDLSEMVLFNVKQTKTLNRPFGKQYDNMSVSEFRSSSTGDLLCVCLQSGGAVVNGKRWPSKFRFVVFSSVNFRVVFDTGRLSGSIKTFCMNPRGTHLAWFTEKKEIVCFSIQKKRRVWSKEAVNVFDESRQLPVPQMRFTNDGKRLMVSCLGLLSLAASTGKQTGGFLKGRVIGCVEPVGADRWVAIEHFRGHDGFDDSRVWWHDGKETKTLAVLPDVVCVAHWTPKRLFLGTQKGAIYGMSTDGKQKIVKIQSPDVMPIVRFVFLKAERKRTLDILVTIGGNSIRYWAADDFHWRATEQDDNRYR